MSQPYVISDVNEENTPESATSVRLEDITREFIARCGREVEGLIIARSDGLVVHAYLTREAGVDERTLSAMVAAAIGASKRVFKQLKNGNINTILIEGDNGKLVIKPVVVDNREVYVGILTPPDANIGLILLELERYMSRLRGVLE